MIDLLLAFAHHLLAFSLAGILAAETALLQPGLSAERLRLLGNLDTTYGIVAGLILVVGFGRVFYGVHGPAFFLANPWFWAKIACFAVVGALSAPPTIRFIAWRRKAKSDGAFVVTADDVRSVRRFFVGEIVFFAFIPLFAAAMVRVPFL
jgi:putative membrane protein